MLPFISFGVISAASIMMGRHFASARKQRLSETPQPHVAASVYVLAQHITEENSVILASENIPMDNRFGNKLLSSEHEFSQTATVSLALGNSRRITAASKSTLWKLLESKTEAEIGKNLGIEIGSQISRKIRLKFATDPGQFVQYRVVWRQQSQRGSFEIRAGKRLLHVPYMVTYGLAHTVESLPGESIAPPPKPKEST